MEDLSSEFSLFEPKKGDKPSAINKKDLPKNIAKKFDMLKSSSLSFQERSDLLSWFVDSMRVEVLDHLEEQLESMDEGRKQDLIDELNSI
jgi:hypothetical protein